MFTDDRSTTIGKLFNCEFVPSLVSHSWFVRVFICAGGLPPPRACIYLHLRHTLVKHARAACNYMDRPPEGLADEVNSKTEIEEGILRDTTLNSLRPPFYSRSLDIHDGFDTGVEDA